MEYHEFRAMNTTIVLAAEADPERAAGGFEAAQAAIVSWERRLTRFLVSSELSRLNRSQGRWFQASPDLFEILFLAQDYHRRTAGIFDPAILPALKRAGYDRSMEAIRSAGPGRSSPAPARAAWMNFGAARLDRATCRIWLPPGMEVDLGGIAKGWIAGRAVQALAGTSAACAVNAGGDIVLHGLPQGQAGWQIALEDPRDPGRALAILRVGPGAVATSAVTRRTWVQDGQPQHHLIDPRRGRPAATAWLSVTVIAALGNPAEQGGSGWLPALAAAAEVYAKALLIAGPEKAGQIGWDDPPFRPEEGRLDFIAVDRAGKMWGSPDSLEYIDDRSISA